MMKSPGGIAKIDYEKPESGLNKLFLDERCVAAWDRSQT